MDEKIKVTNKCPICGRPTHKESEYCIFHASAEEKTEEEFKRELKEYIQEIKKEDKDYNFERFTFIGKIFFKNDFQVYTLKNANFNFTIFKEDVNFHSIIFKGNTSFSQAVFKGDTDFTNVFFEATVDFWNALFQTKADFSFTTFEKYAHYLNVTFKGNSVFKYATFKGNANFLNTKFNKRAAFIKAIFEGYASFKEANFEENINFMDATFKLDADFWKVAFKGNANFLIKTIKEELSFKYAKFSSGKTLKLDIKNNIIIDFEKSSLENVYLEIDLGRDVLIDFTDTLLKNTKITSEQIKNHIFHEEKKKYSRAKEIYLILKNNFHSIGRYEDESWAFKKEKDMERLFYSFYSFKKDLVKKKKREIFPILKWMYTKDFKKWIISAFSNMIYGYGEKPWNVVKTALAIIIIFALSFSLIGIGSPEIIELKGTAVHQNSGNIVDLASKGLLKSNVIRNFPDSLYFSLITFSTLGYGDFRPLEGIGRILAGSEAFIGAFMMALFVYTFARRTGGR